MAHPTSCTELFSSLPGLTVQNVTWTGNQWIVEATSQDGAPCPGCGVVSRSRPSRYYRQIRDLPFQGAHLLLKTQVARWRCQTPECHYQIFTERLPSVVAPQARHTHRLTETGVLVRRLLGSRPSQKLLSRLGMPISRHTVLRRVKQTVPPSEQRQDVRVVSVDDWAWRKGQFTCTTSEPEPKDAHINLLQDVAQKAPTAVPYVAWAVVDRLMDKAFAETGTANREPF